MPEYSAASSHPWLVSQWPLISYSFGVYSVGFPQISSVSAFSFIHATVSLSGVKWIASSSIFVNSARVMLFSGLKLPSG